MLIFASRDLLAKYEIFVTVQFHAKTLFNRDLILVR